MTHRLLFLIAISCVSCGGGDGTGESTLPPSITMSASSFGSGTLRVEGTVDLPADSSADRSIQLYITRSAGTGGGNQIKGSIRTTSATQIRYAISGLPSGDYQIRMQVDENGNGVFSDSGDYEGWYDGSIVAPKQNQATATTIVLSSVSRFNMNFGINALP